MGRKQDKLWVHTDPFGKKFKCNFCGKVFPATTSVVRFRFHLAGIPGQGVHVCNNVPEAIKQEAMDDVPDSLKEESMPIHNNKKKHKSGSTSPNSDSTLSETRDSNCSNEVDNLLAKFFEINDIDCSTVESTSFLNLVDALCKYGPGTYVPPSSATLRSKLIPLFRQEVEQSVANARQSLERTGFTVVPHFWSNQKQGLSFLSIIACSRKSSVLLNTFELPREKSLLEEFFGSVILDVGAENIVQCIVDDNVWAGLFGEFLTKEYPHVCVTKCAALHIQSLSDAICMEFKSVKTTFDEAQVIFDYTCRNTDILGSNGGSKCQSAYDMLGAIFKAKEELVKLVQSSEWPGYGKEENGYRVAQIIKNDEFWDQGKKLRLALKPLLQALHLDDIGELGFDELYRLMKMAEEEIGKLCNNNSPDHTSLSLWGKAIDGIHKVATFLNPQYMCIDTVQDRREMDQGIEFILKKLVTVDDRAAFVDQTLDYRAMLANPSQLFKTLAAKKLSPCEWWNSFGYEFPVLGKYAIRILSQPCSSLSVKSNLSAFLANQIEQRRGLVPGLKDLSLRVNAFFMEKFNTSKAASKRNKVRLELSGEHSLTNNRSHKPVVIVEEELTFRPRMTRSIENISVPQHLKLRFIEMIRSPIAVGQKVEGEVGSQIHVVLEDPTADRVMQIELPSMLRLTVSVLDGDFIDEATSDHYWTGENFDSNDLRLTRKEPLVTGDLEVMLEGGKGVLGEFSFNYSSLGTTRSGQFRLGLKTTLGGYCDGVRVLEGISSAFVVLDNDDTRRPNQSVWELPLPDEFPSNFEGFNELIEHGQHDAAGHSNDAVGFTDVGFIWDYNKLQRCSKPNHVAARRVKKKALLHLHKRLKRRPLQVQSAKENKLDNDDEIMEAAALTVDLKLGIDVNYQVKAIEACDDTKQESSRSAGGHNDTTDNKDVKLFGVQLSDASLIQKTKSDCIDTTLGLSIPSKRKRGAISEQSSSMMISEITGCSVGTHGASRRCKFPRCSQSARGSTNYCISHGGGKRCVHELCTKGARGMSGFCKNHDPVNRRCYFLGCTKSAEGKADYCIAHGGGSQCGHDDGCKSGCCIQHGTGRRCQFLGCTKGVEWKTDYCVAHGQFCAGPKKSELRIGESSAVFTYVESSIVRNNSLPTSHNEGIMRTSSLPPIHNESLMRNNSLPPPKHSESIIRHNSLPAIQSHNESSVHQNPRIMQKTQGKTVEETCAAFNTAAVPENGELWEKSSQGNDFHLQHCAPHMAGMASFQYYPMGMCLPPNQVSAQPWPNSSVRETAKTNNVDRRETALMKFRQKRKERCFDKRIRYVNRKKLAERRPRVKGQFVHSKMNVDLNGTAAEYDDDVIVDEEELASLGYSMTMEDDASAY